MAARGARTWEKLMKLIRHLEQYLGSIERGWSNDADGRALPFQVALFDGKPLDGAKAIATVGLSGTPLQVGDGSRVPLELVMVFKESFSARNLQAVLQQTGVDAIARDRAYERGEVLQLRGPLIAESRLDALYVATPMCLPDGFKSFEAGGETIFFVWLVPITASEAAYVRSHGWEAFEAALLDRKPDLMDFARGALDIGD
jgi:hypothetical protein